MGRDQGIEVENLVREFKKGPRAVDGVDLRVEPGEIYGFLGPNGAGKSTMVLMLTTLLPPTSGTARVAGYDIVREGPRVRAAIGAALQEAALDDFLTGRDHMRLQAALHGLPRAERKKRGDELLERVGLSEAADRRVKGYSGGMKRRLDLALALVHRPQILFLDEPTTGLDPQSRSALWSEVSRLARDEGVTVFLTTQYLEEADVLADRVGIIDRGKIVAEDTPENLKAEIGRPSVEATPSERAERDAVAGVLRGFGEEIAAQPGAVSVRLERGNDLADVVRALDAKNLRVTNLTLDEPSLDDVFLEKTGRSLEGAGENQAQEVGGLMVPSLLTQISALASRSIMRTLRQPAVIVSALLFPMMFFSINASGLDAASRIPGFPGDSYLDFAFALPLIQASLFGSITAGSDLARDIESGFFDRLSLTPMRPVALLGGMLAGVVALGLLQGVVFIAFGLLMGVEISSGILGIVVLVLLTVLVALGFGGVGAILALRTGSVEAVESAFPLFFVAIFMSSINLPRDLIEADWFRFIATINPISYLVEGLRSLVITGWDAQALLLGFGCAAGIIVLSLAGAGASLRTRVAPLMGGGAGGGFFAVAVAVAWRQVYKYFTNPAFLAPAFFPIFFFVAFAGGLTRVGDIPGFDYAGGYIAFQYVWALLQAVAMGGAFTGFSIAGDFENGFASRLMLAASNRSGIILGYTLASLARATVTGTLLTGIALATGMTISGGFDVFGLIGLVALVNVAATLFGAGVAMLMRTQQAGPVIRTPIFLVIFLAPVFVPLNLLQGWIETVARLNPFTTILDAARGFLAGSPTNVPTAFAIALLLVAIFALWALYGLRNAERAG